MPWILPPLRSLPYPMTELPDGLSDGLTAIELFNVPDLLILDGATLPKTLRKIRILHSGLRVVRNLDKLPALMELNLGWARSLRSFESRLPPSLVELRLIQCSSLTTLGPLERSNLRTLDVWACTNLESLPNLPPSLQSLSIADTSIKTLPFLHDATAVVHQNTHELKQAQRESLKRERFALLKPALVSFFSSLPCDDRSDDDHPL